MNPNGQLPAYEWDFGDVNPPVHAWAALGSVRIERGEQTRAIILPGTGFPEAVVEFHLVGQPQGAERATTSFKADSWGWTTSACSTAVRHFRPGVTWNRRRAQRGWPSSSQTCCRSHWNWRCTIRCMKTSPPSSSSISFRSPLPWTIWEKKVRACGTRKMGSITTFSSYRTASYSSVEGALARWPVCRFAPQRYSTAK